MEYFGYSHILVKIKCRAVLHAHSWGPFWTVFMFFSNNQEEINEGYDPFYNNPLVGAVFYFYYFYIFYVLIYFHSQTLVLYLFSFNSSAVWYDTCFLWILCHVTHLWATSSKIKPVNSKMLYKWVTQVLGKMKTGWKIVKKCTIKILVLMGLSCWHYEFWLLSEDLQRKWHISKLHRKRFINTLLKVLYRRENSAFSWLIIQ